LLDSAKLELREIKARSTLLGACTICPVLISDLKATAVEIKDLKHKLDHSSRYTVLSLSCEACVSLKSKLLHATKENTKLQQEISYLTACLEKTALSEKMIEENLSRVEESATKSTYRLGVGFERCEKNGEKSASMFVPSSSCHKEHEALKPTKVHYPSNPKPSFNPKREVRKETPKPREGAFIYMFCGRAGHLEDFSFGGRELRGGMLSMLETHIVMSSLIYYLILILMFCLAFTLVLCLTFFHVLCLSSLMDLTIAHLVLVHERTTLCLDALVMAHVLIVVTVSRISLIFPLEGHFPTLSQDTWMVHIFPVVVHVPLGLLVRCKGL
jgi:hypothetical protein